MPDLEEGQGTQEAEQDTQKPTGHPEARHYTQRPGHPDTWQDTQKLDRTPKSGKKLLTLSQKTLKPSMIDRVDFEFSRQYKILI